MALPQDGAMDNAVIASLYIEAVRKGQQQWFRVVSGSMHPLLRVGEEVRVEPVAAEKIAVGEIAAFETGEGLVIHRIVQRRQADAGIQLVEMSDVHFRVGQVDDGAVIGRVVAVRQGHTSIDLQRPIAQKCGRVTARLRYRFYTMRSSNKLAQVIIRKSARLVARLASWFVRRFCTTSQREAATNHRSN